MNKDLSKKLTKLHQYLNKHTFVFALLIAAVFICFSLLIGLHNNKAVPTTTDPIASYLGEPKNPLSFMARWDGVDYINISKSGYQAVDEANFFPLYPLLVHLVKPVFNSSLDSALAISWLCLIGATYFYIKILKKLFKFKDNISSIKGLIFFILFPTSIFFVATYTESLLALLALGSIYFALNKNYVIPAILMFLGCLSHLDAIFILILVCLILIEEKVDIKKAILTLLAGIFGFVGYAVYLQHKFGQPLAFITAQKGHGWLDRHYLILWQTLDGFNAIFLILLVVSVIYWWNKRRSFSVYSFLFLLIPIIGNQFGGFNRYVLMAFPLQFMAYDYFKDKHMAYSLLLALTGIAWAYFTLQYAGGYVGG